jgi:NitT/TauT family transport system ATP-binding protein
VQGFVTLEWVRHAYGGPGTPPAVDGLTLAIDRGEFAAVVGPSGCGKSTLMKLATGLQFPEFGVVTVAGEVADRPVKIAGMAFQAPTLLPWRTTLDNVLLPLEIVQPHRRRIRRDRPGYVKRAEAILAQELTYTQPFQDMVHELRGHIVEARQ